MTPGGCSAPGSGCEGRGGSKSGPSPLTWGWGSPSRTSSITEVRPFFSAFSFPRTVSTTCGRGKGLRLRLRLRGATGHSAAPHHPRPQPARKQRCARHAGGWRHQADDGGEVQNADDGDEPGGGAGDQPACSALHCRAREAAGGGGARGRQVGAVGAARRGGGGRIGGRRIAGRRR